MESLSARQPHPICSIRIARSKYIRTDDVATPDQGSTSRLPGLISAAGAFLSVGLGRQLQQHEHDTNPNSATRPASLGSGTGGLIMDSSHSLFGAGKTCAREGTNGRCALTAT